MYFKQEQVAFEQRGENQSYRIVVFSYFGPGSKLVIQPLNPNKLLIAQKGETSRLPLYRPLSITFMP